MPISFFVPAGLADGLALREQRSRAFADEFAPVTWVPRFPAPEGTGNSAYRFVR